MNFADFKAALPEGMIAGVDLSAAQGAVDVPALVAAGVAFAWIRATDGLRSGDAQCYRTANACDAAGLPFGLYGVIEPYGIDHAEAQAKFFLNIQLGLRLTATDTLPPVCDFELSKGRTAVDLLESAARWMDVVEQALGRQAVLYASPAFLAQLEQLAGAASAPLVARLAQRPLWLASYGPRGCTPTANLARGWPRSPAGFPEAAIWQVAGDGGVVLPGGHGAVDVDVFRGTVEQLQALGADDLRATLPTGAPAAT